MVIRGRSFVIGGTVAALAIAAVAVAAAQGGGADKSAAAKPGKDFTLGKVIAETGLISFLDNASGSGADLAIEQINADGGADGHQIKTFTLDTKSDPSLGGTLGQEAVDRGINAMAVSCDFDFGAGAATVAAANDLLNISLCASSLQYGPEGIGDLSFSAGTYVGVESAIMAEFAMKRGWDSAYVLTNTTINYCKVAASTFKTRYDELGGKVVGEDTYQINDVSIATQISKLKSASPQPKVIMLAGVQPDGPAALKQIRAAGLRQPIITNQNFDGDFWKASVPNISDVYLTSYASMYGDDPRPDVNQFFKDLAAKTGKPPISGLPIVGYAFVQALAGAIEDSGSMDSAKIASSLETGGIETVLGKFQVDDKVHIDLKRPEVILEIQDGKTRFLDLATATSVPIVPGS